MISIGLIFYIIIWILVGVLLTYVIRAYLPLDARINQILIILVWLLIIWQILALLGLVSGVAIRA